jgi:hypothetical protein
MLPGIGNIHWPAAAPDRQKSARVAGDRTASGVSRATVAFCGKKGAIQGLPGQILADAVDRICRGPAGSKSAPRECTLFLAEILRIPAHGHDGIRVAL